MKIRHTYFAEILKNSSSRAQDTTYFTEDCKEMFKEIRPHSTLFYIEQHILMMLSNNVSSSLKPPEKEIINFAFTSQPTFQDRLPVTIAVVHSLN